MTNFFDTVSVSKFKSTISYKTKKISGIIICKILNDSTLAGGFINEFGIKWFDFTVTENRAQIGYLFKSLDKWYIRRKLETDLHFLLVRPKLNTTCSINDTSMYVAAINRSLHYVYNFIDEKRIVRADMYKGAFKVASLQQYYNEMAGIVLKMDYADGSLSYEFCEINN